MKKIIMLMGILAIGSSAFADYTVQTVSPAIPIQTYGSYYGQGYNQAYNPVYTQNYGQNYYQNPYQTQCQNPYTNPYYQYQRTYPYGGINNPLSTLGNTTNGNNQIIKNIGQSVLYSMLRGY